LGKRKANKQATSSSTPTTIELGEAETPVVEKTPTREAETDDDGGGGGSGEEEAGKRSDTRVQDAASQDPLLERMNTSQRQTAAGKRSKEDGDCGGVASASGEPQHDSQRIGDGDDTGETEINPTLTLVTKRRNAHRKKVKPAKDRPHSADEASSSGTVCMALSLSLCVRDDCSHHVLVVH
jgi:hypothetical protein